jgi:hypothetical protein
MSAVPAVSIGWSCIHPPTPTPPPPPSRQVVDTQNQYVVVVSYAVMFAYITAALGKFPHPIFTRASLGLQGICIVAGSVVSAIGICAWCGLHITMIVNEVVPFLILALGVDNMFILTKAFDRHWRGPYRGLYDPVAAASGGQRVMYEGREDPATAIALALADVGPTISAAAVCEVLAFGVGATTEIPALQQFCLVAAVAVAIDFFLQVTWFSAALMLDAYRQESNRCDCCPLLRRKLSPEHVAAMNAATAADPSRSRGSRASASINAPAGTSSVHEDAASELSAALLTKSPLDGAANGHSNGGDAGLHKDALEGWKDGYGHPAPPPASLRARCRLCVMEGQYVRHACQRWYAPWLLWWPIRVVVLAVWALFLAGSGYGMTQVRGVNDGGGMRGGGGGGAHDCVDVACAPRS